MTDVSKPTIVKLLADLGTVCAQYHDAHVRELRCQRIQCDEIWSFVGAKQKNVREEKRDVWRDLWTWTCIDADTKLIVSYLVGPRITPNAWNLMRDLFARVINRRQITTEALAWYKGAIEEAFPEVDYATVITPQNHYLIYFSTTTRLRALTRRMSGTLRLVERFRRSLSLRRARKFIDSATGVLGFFTSACTTA